MFVSVLGRLVTAVVALSLTLSLLIVLAPHTPNISLLLQPKLMQEYVVFRRLHTQFKVQAEVRPPYKDELNNGKKKLDVLYL